MYKLSFLFMDLKLNDHCLFSYLYFHFYMSEWINLKRFISFATFFVHALFDSTGKNNHHIIVTMLTEDAISLLLHGVVNLWPLVQVSTLNQVNSLNSSTIRFWISISDGLHKHAILLLIIYNNLVEYGKLKEGTIIKVTQCTCNIVHNVTHDSFSQYFFPT